MRYVRKFYGEDEEDMKKLLSAIAMLVVVLLLPIDAQAASPQADNVIIKYHAEDAKFIELSKLDEKMYIDEQQQFISIPKKWLADEDVKALIKSASVTYIESDYKRTTTDLKGHLEDWDTTTLGVPELVNNLQPQQQTIVAVVDSGVDYNHPALKDYMLPGYDFVEDDEDPMDENSHGTHVAGIILRGANYEGVKILPVRVMGADGSGTDSQITSGIRYAVDQGATVINMSLGGQGISQTQREAILYALDHDVSVIVASGNEDSEIYNKYPASERDVLTIGASAKNKARAAFSNYGLELDLMAPGQHIYSAIPRNLDKDDDRRDGYAFMDGTSMATPFVSGVVGLIRATHPELSHEEIEILLKNQAQRPENNDFDQEIGFGHVKANNFTTDTQAFLLNTTFLTEGADQVEVGTFGYTTGSIELQADGKTIATQNITKNGFAKFDVTVPKADEMVLTAILRDADGIEITTAERTAKIITKDVIVSAQNELGQPAEINIATLYGEKAGVVEELTMFIETNSKGDAIALATSPFKDYDKFYVTFVADKAFYAQKIEREANLQLTADQLQKVTAKNGLFSYPNEKRFENLYQFKPPYLAALAVIDNHRFPSLMPANYLEEPELFVASGNYDFKFIDMGKYNAFLTLSNIEVTQNKTINFKDAGPVARMQVAFTGEAPLPILSFSFELVGHGQSPLKVGVDVNSPKPIYVTHGTYDAYIHLNFMGMPFASSKAENVRINSNRTLQLTPGDGENLIPQFIR